MEMPEREVIQEKSDIDIFNKIGSYYEEKGHHVVYFKVARAHYDFPSLEDVLNGRGVGEIKSIGWEYTHHMHILKNDDGRYCIYYDEKDLLGMRGEPYYETWNSVETNRFTDADELFEFVKEELK